ncbi:MAG: hypothetical protein E6K10_09895 [Methanobacteriota archaeon]|nr:MAG: hypothetical protein E6K10_09895 [Euryarchaeota archaeon]
MSGLRRHAGVLGFLVCAGFVLAMVLSTPALATTTVQQVEGSNIIASDGTCGSWVFEPTPPQHTYHHVNGDSVTLPMVNKWSDQRAAGSPGRTLASSWSASYGGVGYGWGGLHHYSTGNDFGYETGSGSVPNVQVGTSMDVTYKAYVYDPNFPGIFLCYTELTVTYNFIP